MFYEVSSEKYRSFLTIHQLVTSSMQNVIKQRKPDYSHRVFKQMILLPTRLILIWTSPPISRANCPVNVVITLWWLRLFYISVYELYNFVCLNIFSDR